MVMSLPLIDLTVPPSDVTVMKPVPALFGTTVSEWTPGPPGPPGPWKKPPARGKARFVAVALLLLFFFELLLGAAALPAIPASAPTSAQTTMTTPSWGSLMRLMVPQPAPCP